LLRRRGARERQFLCNPFFAERPQSHKWTKLRGPPASHLHERISHAPNDGSAEAEVLRMAEGRGGELWKAGRIVASTTVSGVRGGSRRKRAVPSAFRCQWLDLFFRRLTKGRSLASTNSLQTEPTLSLALLASVRPNTDEGGPVSVGRHRGLSAHHLTRPRLPGVPALLNLGLPFLEATGGATSSP
jgi:hypothetical protein